MIFRPTILVAFLLLTTACAAPRIGLMAFPEGKVQHVVRAEAKREDATEFGPGDYYVNKRHEVHQVWIEGPTVLQITGIGPWKAIPIAEALPPS